MSIAIIGDDLSGSNDTAVYFSNYGFISCVLNYPEGFQYEMKECDVLAISTNTRDMSVMESKAIVTEVSEYLVRLGVDNVYKKIDSTWRGNIGTEIEAIMETMDIRIAIICSSFPEMSRTVKNGYLYINGVLLENTPIANDPGCPVRESYLPRLLKTQTNLPIQLIDHHTVSQGSMTLTKRILEVSGKEKMLILVDAETEEDLKTIVSVDRSLLPPMLFCGSAGMSSAMLSAGKIITIPKAPPVLVIVGSVHPQNRLLIEKAVKNHSAEEVFINPDMLIEGIIDDAVLQSVEACIVRGNSVILHTYQNTEDRKTTRERTQSEGIDSAELSASISRGLQHYAGSLLKTHLFSGIIVTGGTTALHVLRGIEGAGVKMVEELEVGLPYGTVIGGPLHGIGIITKAGGFGSASAFSDGINFLKKKYLMERGNL